MEILQLGYEHLDALTDFARDPSVVRFGDHISLTPRSAWATWLAELDTNRVMTLAAFDGGRIRALARLTTTDRRRASHAGLVHVLAPWEDGDPAVDLVLGALVDTADRWMQLVRLELHAPAGHRRVAGVYAAHGFEIETTMRASISVANGFGDEVGLARIRAPAPAPSDLVGPPLPPPRKGAPSNLRIRALDPEDAESWTRTLSDPTVIWGTLQLPHQRQEQWAERIRSGDPSRVLVLGADVGGVIVAGSALMISSALRRRHCARLGMHVSGPLQGRGIGRRLMNEALELAETIGLRRIELEVFGDNTRAVSLYESAGFELEGMRRLTCYREGALVDDLMMARVLEGV